MTKPKLWTRNYILVLPAVVFAAFTHSSFTTIFPLYVLDIGGKNSGPLAISFETPVP